MRGRRVLPGLGVTGVIACAIVATVAMADSSSTPGRGAQPTVTEFTSAARVAAVSQRQRATLRAFARPARSADRLPPDVRANIERVAHYGENTDLARKVLEMPSGHSLYMVPAANDLVGIYDAAGGGGVTDLAHIQAGESYGVDVCAPNLAPGWARYYGELPSDAGEVELILNDGSTMQPVLGENAWGLDVAAARHGGLPDRLRFVSAGVQREVAIHSPSDLTAGTCRRAE